jgi:hypothetical protein
MSKSVLFFTTLILSAALLTACSPVVATALTATPPIAVTSQLATMVPTVAMAGPTVVPSTAPAAAVPAQALLTVTLADGSQKPFSMADLKQLPAITVNLDGVDQNGPALLEVLKAAGVSDFTSVTVSGVSSLTLNKSDITAETLFDFSNRNTIKLASANIAKDKWVKDVTQITIK